MSALPQIKIIFDRRKTATATTKGSVEIEVYYNRERVRLSTGVSVNKTQWRNDSVVNHPNAEKLNDTITLIYESISNQVKYMVRNDIIDLQSLKKTKNEEQAFATTDFLQWLESRIMMRMVKESTRRQHLVMLDNLRKFGKIRYFCDLTSRNIQLWDDLLHKQLGTQSSVHGYHKRLKPYIIEAKNLQLIRDNPYDTLRIPRGKSEGIKFLTEAERKRIEELELYGPTEKVRDMFIFSCYTGLAYSDLIKVNRATIFEENGKFFIMDSRVKTGGDYRLTILPPAMAILKKYNFNLNLMTNQKCNEYLKIIASMANVHINLTMHVGRHTFATWALSQNVPIATVSKMLAHSDVKMTEKYAKVLQNNVDDGFDHLLSRIG